MNASKSCFIQVFTLSVHSCLQGSCLDEASGVKTATQTLVVASIKGQTTPQASWNKKVEDIELMTTFNLFSFLESPNCIEILHFTSPIFIPITTIF